MNTIEIRRGTGVLILARPGVLPLSARKASDRQQLGVVLAGLALDRAAMSALRAGWSSVFSSSGVMLMTDDGLATQVRNALAARQVEAVLLRDAAIPLTPAELTFLQSAIASVRTPRGQLIVAGKGAMPANLRPYLNPGQVKHFLGAMQDFDEGAQILDRQAAILAPFGLGGLRGRALRNGISAKIDHGFLDAAYVPPGPVGDAVDSQLNTGGAVSEMGYADKVGAALMRSLPHLTGEVKAAVAQMVTPTNLAIMAAVFVAVALANTNPVTGAAMDTILIGVAWWSAGLTGIRAIGHFIEATTNALKAKNEADLDAAGQVYAKALVGLGSALIQALMARFLTKKGGTAEEGPKSPGRGQDPEGAGQTGKPATTEQPQSQSVASEQAPPKAPSEGIPPLRQKYIDEVEGLAGKADNMRAEGSSPEQIARTLHADRRALGVKYKDLTPELKRLEIYERNLKTYGDKLGPSIDWLRAKGKSWEQIIESATRTGGKDLKF